LVLVEHDLLVHPTGIGILRNKKNRVKLMI
jgi:hypothetical protein